MDMLQKAIEEITYFSDIFPEEEFQVITANKEEAVPYLREAVEYVLRNRTELEEDYQLYFYAIYLLAEFGDRESFPRIVELASLPDREADALLGDCITSDLSDILYNTFDGNLELLERTIKNADVNVYVRAAMLDVVGQLYLDGILQEGEWKDFLRQNVYCGREYDYLYDAVGCMLCQCHFYDMLPEIRYMFEIIFWTKYRWESMIPMWMPCLNTGRTKKLFAGIPFTPQILCGDGQCLGKSRRRKQLIKKTSLKCSVSWIRNGGIRAEG